MVGQVPITQDNGVLGHIDIAHLGHDHRKVSLAREYRAQGIGNIAGRYTTSGDLIQQRLKEVKVAFIHQGNAHRRTP